MQLISAFGLRLVPIVMLISTAGCFSSPKRKPQVAPAVPLDNFKPMPDPRAQGGAGKLNSTGPARIAPAQVVAPRVELPQLPALQQVKAEEPKLAAPPVLPKAIENPIQAIPAPEMPPLPKLTPPTGSLDITEPKTLVRASSNELARPADHEFNELAALLDRAEGRLQTIQTLEARLTMKDLKEGRQQPVEVVRFFHGLKPYAVRMTWVGEHFHGRDLIYVAGKYEGKMQMLTAKGDIPLLGVQQMAFLPDDPTLKAKSKHDIRDAGPGYPIRHLRKLQNAKTFASRLTDRGMTARNDYPNPLRLIEESVPHGDRDMPVGGKRQYFFDAGEGSPTRDLPVVFVETETGGRNAESMVFDQFKLNHLSEKDFDAKRLGK